MGAIRLLTYNIHHAEGNDGRIDPLRIAAVIRESNADVVGLNEVHHPAVLQGSAAPYLDQIARAADMAYVFGAALAHEAGWVFPAPYGNALLSRFPLGNAATGLLPGAPGREVRGVVSAQVSAPLNAVCYVTHLENRSEELRLRQLERLLGILAAETRPHILIGDLNAVSAGEESHEHPASGVPARLRAAGYVDAQAGVGALAPTCPATSPVVRIDYVWLSPEVAPALRRCEPWDTPLARLASDHLPVLAVLETAGE